MLESASDAAIQLVAGTTAIGCLGTLVLTRLGGAPRPCWAGKGCAIRQGDAMACGSCAVYLASHSPEHDYGDLPELGEVRSLAGAGAD